MHPIIYDVAVSLDGFISGPAGDIAQFAHDGPVVDDYHSRRSKYKTAIMGRTTYEFGYEFGLKPGQNPYPHMKTIVFSQSIIVPEKSEISVVPKAEKDEVTRLKSTTNGPIYMCGGGALAGWLLKNHLIDRLILKRAPHVFGSGVQLFGDASNSAAFIRTGTKTYENGYLLEEFDIT